MAEAPDELENATKLTAKTNQVGMQFLLTEVQAGMTLLDTVDSSRDDAANSRRRSLALEAYGVVAERLERSGPAALLLSAEEREQIVQAHAELGRRLGR